MDEAPAGCAWSGEQARGDRDLDRRIIQLKIEREALKKERTRPPRTGSQALEEELANLEQQSAELTQRWQAEKDKIQAEAKIKEQLDAARLELEQAQRGGDLAKAGELLRRHPRAREAARRGAARQPARCCARK